MAALVKYPEKCRANVAALMLQHLRRMFNRVACRERLHVASLEAALDGGHPDGVDSEALVNWAKHWWNLLLQHLTGGDAQAGPSNARPDMGSSNGSSKDETPTNGGKAEVRVEKSSAQRAEDHRSTFGWDAET